MDAVEYFRKVIRESIKDPKEIMLHLAKQENGIGDYLSTHPTLLNTLIKLEHVWKFDHQNDTKDGFEFKGFVDDREKLKKAYKVYLEEYPAIFEKHLPLEADYSLEDDFKDYVEEDLNTLKTIVNILKHASKYKYERPHKSLNLFIWSKKPSFGKTRLLEFFIKHMVTYRLPDDQYYTDYQNLRYDVLVSDEAKQFLKTKDYSHLKHIFEGIHVEFNRKHRSKVIKSDNPLMVLADNVSFDTLMEKLFPGEYNQEVMSTRVIDLEIKSRATMHFLLDRCMEAC
jgi:hypothetical protein